MGALEVGAAGTLVTGLEHGFAPKRFLDRKAPLTDVLRRTSRISRGEADHGRPENRRREVEAGEARDEIVALVCLGKDQRWHVALIAERVHVHRREEDAEGAARHKTTGATHHVSEPQARCEVEVVRVNETARHAQLPADKGKGPPVLEHQIAVRIGHVVERGRELIAQPEVQRRGVGDSPVVLHESVGVRLAEVHGRNTRLPLLHHGQSQEETGKRCSGAVVGAGGGREAVCKLVEPAVLEKSPHRPKEPPVIAAGPE